MKGFFIAILQDVTHLMDKYKDYKRLVVNGHSLGAALGSLAVLDFARMHDKENLFITFGQPRVGNKEFAAYFDSMIANPMRLVHYHDIVPHIPFEWMGYS